LGITWSGLQKGNFANPSITRAGKIEGRNGRPGI
jgi:hypothetical protein